MPVRERILTTGVTGSGKTWQWLQLARALKSTGAIFRCIDTDAAIRFMLETGFPDLLPENGGNVIVYDSTNWPLLREARDWLKKEPVKPIDWLVIDMIDVTWEFVQRHFVGSVFEEDMGEYFLQVRRDVQARGGVGADGKQVTSIIREGLSGWVDWSVINKMYNDVIPPLLYTTPCHVYAAAKVQEIPRNEKDPEIMNIFGEMRLRPSGQKNLGHQLHSIFLLKPGIKKWFITTMKDRGNRTYFEDIQLHSFYKQYLVVKAGWPMV